MSKKEVKKITKQFILNQLEENEVDLSMNELDTVPVRELALVTKGTKLDVSRNHLKFLPDNFGLLRHLVGLDLSSNQLQSLPDSFGKLVLLQKLDLYSNQLTRLPLTFWQLKKLSWLDLKNNPLEGGLTEAAGTCVSPKECNQCATRVLAYVKNQQSKNEKERQYDLERYREEEKRKKEEEKKKKDAVKREKEMIRQMKQEDLELQIIRNREKALAKQEALLKAEEMSANEETRILTSGGGSGGSGGWSRVGCVCTSVILTTVAIMTMLVMGITLCNYVMDTSSCQVLRLSLIKSMARFLDLLGLTD